MEERDGGKGKIEFKIYITFIQKLDKHLALFITG